MWKFVILYRYIGQKKYEELQGMLFDGAVLLFSHQQVASGTDLAKLYIDTLNEAESSPEEIHFIRISKWEISSHENNCSLYLVQAVSVDSLW